ncbi:unnamed protein product [Paramecium octaurelia]|uniref:Transmembrane protein n=1 Tax=Paramecium octaurelia TaxID=43137 RepID=A0A8S1YN11_PAROT|nr:unnamed protein product [Paramecium octaurelia]
MINVGYKLLNHQGRVNMGKQQSPLMLDQSQIQIILIHYILTVFNSAINVLIECLRNYYEYDQMQKCFIITMMQLYGLIKLCNRFKAFQFIKQKSSLLEVKNL